MRRFTTCDVEHIVPKVDLTEGCDVYLTIRQGSKVLTVDDVTVLYAPFGDQTVVRAHLTQEQTGMFSTGVAQVQVNWVRDGDERDASHEANIFVEQNLLDMEVSYGAGAGTEPGQEPSGDEPTDDDQGVEP